MVDLLVEMKADSMVVLWVGLKVDKTVAKSDD
jgi:hypothetical protein